MRLFTCLTSTIACLLTTSLANTEKVILVAPANSRLPDSKPGIDFLNIKSIAAQDGPLRTSLSVSFASEDQPEGIDHWYLLRGLHEKQRYELRVCWSATQPTRFNIDVHTISNVFDQPHLIQNLAKVVQRSDPKFPHSGRSEGDSQLPGTYDSVLYLHIQAAADFFSSNKTLMSTPPAVDVDIILDRYSAGIFPQSLLSTALYLVVITTVGYLVSHIFWRYLQPTTTTKPHND